MAGQVGLSDEGGKFSFQILVFGSYSWIHDLTLLDMQYKEVQTSIAGDSPRLNINLRVPKP